MKSYLVTGGAGFLGSAFVRRLVDGGHRVRVLDNLSRGDARRLSSVMGRIEFVEGDVREPKVVEAAAAGMDAVCHLAFVNGTEFFYNKPELVLEVGVKGMMNVLDACMKHGVPELVLASSSEVYQTPPVIPTAENAPLVIPDPFNPRYSYAAGKIISEMLAIHCGKKKLKRVLIFRPHNVYGPDMGFEHVVPQFILRMKVLCASGQGPVDFPIQGSGAQTRAFVYIDDFMDGLLCVLEKGEHLGIYHIGTSEELSIGEVARLVGEYFKREVRIVPGKEAEGGTARRCPDIGKLAAFGYKPKHAFREGLALTAKWYVDHAETKTAKEITWQKS